MWNEKYSWHQYYTANVVTKLSDSGKTAAERCLPESL